MVDNVAHQIKELIQVRGRITFAEFMEICLYSQVGGFYSSRQQMITSHFTTSPTSHPVCGALLARQLEQMWSILGTPNPFYVIEVGAGDGALARSINLAVRERETGLAVCMRYVATDYQPLWPGNDRHNLGWGNEDRHGESRLESTYRWDIQRIKADGFNSYRNVNGCILSNELIDNFPVHRFVVQDHRVKEIFVTVQGDQFIEVLDDPSTPKLEERLEGLGVLLCDGFRGEVNLGIENWVGQVARALDHGFVLTIDYGQLALDLYSPSNSRGTLVCYHRHASNMDPYINVGQQDITSEVDFTSLMGTGERFGLQNLGFCLQSSFFENLGFNSFLDGLQNEGLSHARTELRRMAMMALVDPEQMGNFKVLIQGKNVDTTIGLIGLGG